MRVKPRHTPSRFGRPQNQNDLHCRAPQYTHALAAWPWPAPQRHGFRRVNNLDIGVKGGDTDGMATVVLTLEAQELAERLPVAIRARLHRLLARIWQWPNVSGVKRLSGNLAGWYRKRTGDYRVRFRVKGETVTVDKIGHRSDIYED
jgi:mRNA-degrading endonuclease RelE of RelBE toxin-antitoxin system